MNQVVLLVIIATVLISLKGFKDLTFFEKYKFQVSKILGGEKIRMLTSGFLHADWIHLGFNMYTLYLFGGIVVTNLGVMSFLIIYFGSLLVGSVYSLYYHKKEPYYSAIGASGAVSGVLYSAIMLYPEMKLMMIPIPIPIPAPILGVGYLLYSIYGMKNKLGNVGHSAHLGGAIGGFLLTILVQPNIVLHHQKIVLLLAIPIVGLLLFGNKLKR